MADLLIYAVRASGAFSSVRVRSMISGRVRRWRMGCSVLCGKSVRAWAPRDSRRSSAKVAIASATSAASEPCSRASGSKLRDCLPQARLMPQHAKAPGGQCPKSRIRRHSAAWLRCFQIGRCPMACGAGNILCGAQAHHGCFQQRIAGQPFAPCRPVAATSPTAHKPSTLVRPARSVATPPI